MYQFKKSTYCNKTVENKNYTWQILYKSFYMQRKITLEISSLVCIEKSPQILIHSERSNMFQLLLWSKSTRGNRNAL